MAANERAGCGNESSLTEFFTLIGNLKHVERTGWVNCKVQNPERIAGHMYRMGIMAMTVKPPPNTDVNRCVRMALIHDMAECIVGDLTPYCGITKEVKHKQEEDAMTLLCSHLEDDTAKEFFMLYKEYEGQETPTSRFVKDLDRYDMILQAFEYETKENRPKQLQSFFDSTNGKFTTDSVIELTEILYKKRLEFISKSAEQTS